MSADIFLNITGPLESTAEDIMTLQKAGFDVKGGCGPGIQPLAQVVGALGKNITPEDRKLIQRGLDNEAEPNAH